MPHIYRSGGSNGPANMIAMKLFSVPASPPALLRVHLRLHRLIVAVAPLWSLFCIVSGGWAQAPPDPNYQRQQIFPSYQDFKNQLTAAAGNAAQLDAMWSQLRSAGQVPYAQGNQVALLYRGPATSVQFAGDFNGWSPSGSWPGCASTTSWPVSVETSS